MTQEFDGIRRSKPDRTYTVHLFDVPSNSVVVDFGDGEIFYLNSKCELYKSFCASVKGLLDRCGGERIRIAK